MPHRLHQQPNGSASETHASSQQGQPRSHLQGASDVRQRSFHPVRLLHAYCNRGELMPPHQQLQIRLRDQPVHKYDIELKLN